MAKPICPEVRADSGMRPVMGTDALAWHRQHLAGGSFAKPFLEPPKGQTALWAAPFIYSGKERAQSMDERYIAAENSCIQQNYFIRLCMGCSHLDRMEAGFYKAQAGIWRHRAKQLEAESQDLCSRTDSLQDRIAWYRARCHELKEENRLLRAELARMKRFEV